MRVKTTVEQTIEKKITTCIKCDGCGKEGNTYHSQGYTTAWNCIDWDDGGFGADGQLILCTYKDRAAPGVFEIIICPECFKKVLLIFNMEKQFKEYLKTKK